MENKLNRSGFTSLGFSKSGFGCCGHWQTCSMGKLECHYATIDPEVKEYCHCYKRNHKIQSDNDITAVTTEPKNLSIRVNKEESKKPNEIEQLSLF